jgi:RHS repeat-associated protein
MHRVYNFNPGSDNGNVITMTDCQHTDRTQNFDYDSLNRIKDGYTSGSGTTATNWGETYTIDPWGNLTNIGLYPGKHNSESLNAPANTLNQLAGFNYDAAGNLTQNGSTTYTYDAENRITATSGYTYVYDGDGQWVIKCSGTYPTCATGTLYWRGNAPDALAELTFTGSASQEYAFFNGKRVARRAGVGNTVYYYFADHLGSTGEITLASGAIDKTTVYYPYGGEISVNGPNFVNNYKFTGKERDAESGLDDFGARYNTSNLGRFMTPDWAAKPTTVPYANFGNPQSLNLYSYVENNPTTVGDPDGHQTGCNQGQAFAGICDENSPGVEQAPASAQQAAQNSTAQRAEGALDWFNGTLGLGKSDCAGGTAASCINAVGMAGAAIVAAVDSGGESEEPALARSETKIANLAKGLAKEGSLERAEAEVNGGMKVIREDGKVFEHAENYVKQHIGGLDKQADHLERFIREHPGLTDSQKERAISAIRFARDTADAARTIITPRDPI